MTAFLALLGPWWTWFLPIFTGAFKRFMLFCSEPANLAIAALLMAVSFGWGHHEGKLSERHTWERRIAAERAYQERVTKAADVAAEKDIDELNGELEAANATIDKLKTEAAADPNAARVCLGTDSLRRINEGRSVRP